MSHSFPPLNTTQLRKLLLRRHGTHTLGVFSLDQLPSNLPRDKEGSYCFIVNTDPGNLPGTHWLAVYVNKTSRKAQVFDSYGRPPPLMLQKWLIRNMRYWSFTKRFIQGPLSNLCGIYCLYMLDRKCFTDLSFMELVHSDFDDISTLNDAMILSYSKTIM